jgi:putative protein-disulfide isomerase
MLHFILIFLLHMNTFQQADSAPKVASKTKVYYVFDPLCGWCYGFSPVIQQAAKDWNTHVDVEVVVGGMVTGSREGIMDPGMAKYILSAFPRVEQYTGVTFGEPYKKQLESGKFYSSSVASCRAVVAFRQLNPGKTLEFISTIQKKMFLEGSDLQIMEEMAGIAATLGVDKTAFLKIATSAENKKATEADFNRSSTMGVTGFPALVIEQNGRFQKITEGYASKTDVDALFKNLGK